MDHDVEITPSSGNVFADLGLPNPEELELKSQLVSQIRLFIEQKGWTQVQTAEVIGMPQSKVSLLLRGRLNGFSVERLLTILQRLGHDVAVPVVGAESNPAGAQLVVRGNLRVRLG